MSESIGSIDTVYRKSSDSEITTIEYNPDYRFSVNENNRDDTDYDINRILLRDKTKNTMPICFYICLVFIIMSFIFVLIIIILNAVKII